MNKLLKNKIEFEVINRDDESITYKRVLSKNLPKRERFKREMQLPKLTVHFFEPDDLEHLQEIRLKLYEECSQRKQESSIRKKIIDFLTK